MNKSILNKKKEVTKKKRMLGLATAVTCVGIASSQVGDTFFPHSTQLGEDSGSQEIEAYQPTQFNELLIQQVVNNIQFIEDLESATTDNIQDKKDTNQCILQELKMLERINGIACDMYFPYNIKSLNQLFEMLEQLERKKIEQISTKQIYSNIPVIQKSLSNMKSDNEENNMILLNYLPTLERARGILNTVVSTLPYSEENLKRLSEIFTHKQLLLQPEENIMEVKKILEDLDLDLEKAIQECKLDLNEVNQELYTEAFYIVEDIAINSLVSICEKVLVTLNVDEEFKKSLEKMKKIIISEKIEVGEYREQLKNQFIDLSQWLEKFARERQSLQEALQDALNRWFGGHEIN
ncbi:hypothetical protein D927_00744 [Enterococcus faecalis 02-MB-BW-10]|uniref:hypothetical protein n=1 Tax=Enterococcus faecalis TaxID=1351 RepID=UPI0003543C45|nr:hypothetical protein [Enterococcus faecalis]EPH84150.1 hypothetical protein D927_00744 [Enterococcus faecalis 02-MB-BW-10]